MKNSKGFTLVELMIALVMTGIIVAAVYSIYTLQQRTQTAQDQVAEMQQNIRAGTLTMLKQFRMAGYDPHGTKKAVINEAYSDAIYFTADLNEDGDVSVGSDDIGEHIAFDLYTDANGVSVLGITRDKNPIVLTELPAGSGHYEAVGHQPIAENIEAIEFIYLDKDGNSLPAPVVKPADVRTITISILARTSWQDTKFLNDTIYTPASGTPWDLNGGAAGNAANDNYRRRILITSVQCRNMGL